MKFFTFKSAVKGNYFKEENGFAFRLKVNKVGCFMLLTPIQKEITHSKGTSIRYMKHSIIGLGYVDGESNFRGLALFDMSIRALIVLLIALGVGYVSYSIWAGVFWAFLFYLLITFLSSADDDSLLWKTKRFYESLES